MTEIIKFPFAVCLKTFAENHNASAVMAAINGSILNETS